MKKLNARNHYLIAFWCTLAVSLGLIITGFFTPPRAQVDGSVLESVGLIFLWPALAFGNKALEEGKIAKITKGDTEIAIGDADELDPSPM